MSTDKIKKDINKDISEEFSKLKNELQIELKSDFDVSQKKDSLKNRVPEEIMYKSELLLDNVLNYLMEDAQNRIKNADVKIQNKFYDADFREIIGAWVNKPENKLRLRPDSVIYSGDPRLIQGMIVGLVFIAIIIGITSLTLNIIVGIITTLISLVPIAITYNKASSRAREIVKKDIDNYLAKSEKQVSDWLERVINHFEKEFQKFCSDNGIKLKGGLNG